VFSLSMQSGLPTPVRARLWLRAADPSQSCARLRLRAAGRGSRRSPSFRATQGSSLRSRSTTGDSHGAPAFDSSLQRAADSREAHTLRRAGAASDRYDADRLRAAQRLRRWGFVGHSPQGEVS
jgi:hypothetical protein